MGWSPVRVAGAEGSTNLPVRRLIPVLGRLQDIAVELRVREAAVAAPAAEARHQHLPGGHQKNSFKIHQAATSCRVCSQAPHSRCREALPLGCRGPASASPAPGRRGSSRCSHHTQPSGGSSLDPGGRSQRRR